MTNRLPTPGSDDGMWGTILNGFLDVAHNSDGSLQTNAIQTAGAITSVNTLTPQSGALTLHATDLADTSIAGPTSNQVLAFNGGTSKWMNATLTEGDILNLTSDLASKVQIGGDLSGSASSPTVARVNGVTVSGTAASGKALVASGSTSASWGVVPGTTSWYNIVTMYGADPTGTADSTTAIQSAINAANTAGGGVVYVPAGTYKISSALTISDHVCIKGDSRNNSLIRQSSTTADAFSWTGSNLEYVTFEDLQINGPGSGSGTGISLMASTGGNPNVLGCRFSNLLVQSFGADGIAAQLLIVSQFDNVIVTTCGGDGFSLTGSVDTSVVFNSCYANANRGTGYDLENLTYCTLNACAADSNNLGYYIFGSGGVTLNSCGAESSPYGFKISDSTGVVLNGCLTFANSNTSFWVTNSSSNISLIGLREAGPNGATASIRTDTGTMVTLIGYSRVTPLSLASGTFNEINDGSTGELTISGTSYVGAFNIYGIASLKGGSDTSGTAVSGNPTFTSGTARQLSTTQDVILYIAVQTSAALAVAIGPTSATGTTIMPSNSYGIGLYTIRIPMTWYVKITGTIANLSVAMVAC